MTGRDYGKRLKEKICKDCERPYVPATANSKCRRNSCVLKRRSRNRRMMAKQIEGLSRGSLGTIGEMKASIDLIKRGFEVFRALSPTSTFDLVASKNDKLYRVEVRFSNFSNVTTGKLYLNRDHRADVLAIVTDQGVTYEPSDFDGYNRL